MTLKITDLGCGYSSGFSLRGISLNLNSGEVLILKGKNGVGKTTLLRAIIGLIAINAGTITIDGVDVTNQNRCQSLTMRAVPHYQIVYYVCVYAGFARGCRR